MSDRYKQQSLCHKMPEGSVQSGVKISVCRLSNQKQQQYNLQLDGLQEKQVHGVEWDVQLY